MHDATPGSRLHLRRRCLSAKMADPITLERGGCGSTLFFATAGSSLDAAAAALG